jgi:hypothetical protein
MIIADALNKKFGYADADTDYIYAPPGIVSMGVGKGHVGGQTVYKNGPIDTRFNKNYFGSKIKPFNPKNVL